MKFQSNITNIFKKFDKIRWNISQELRSIPHNKFQKASKWLPPERRYCEKVIFSKVTVRVIPKMAVKN